MNNIQTHRLGTYLLEVVTNGCSFPIQLLAMCCDFSGYNTVCSKKSPRSETLKQSAIEVASWNFSSLKLGSTVRS